ncbi:hypothetical protein WJX84_002835 [Apatococcus fuscideae]|uniref:Uncharacterized protein n=1 Tax=Apatococcus fuscideae TaxID=2026836 RepID=A0AAW1SJ57_9CHLO
MQQPDVQKGPSNRIFIGHCSKDAMVDDPETLSSCLEHALSKLGLKTSVHDCHQQDQVPLRPFWYSDTTANVTQQLINGAIGADRLSRKSCSSDPQRLAHWIEAIVRLEKVTILQPHTYNGVDWTFIQSVVEHAISPASMPMLDDGDSIKANMKDLSSGHSRSSAEAGVQHKDELQDLGSSGDEMWSWPGFFARGHTKMLPHCLRLSKQLLHGMKWSSTAWHRAHSSWVRPIELQDGVADGMLSHGQLGKENAAGGKSHIGLSRSWRLAGQIETVPQYLQRLKTLSLCTAMGTESPVPCSDPPKCVHSIKRQLQTAPEFR